MKEARAYYDETRASDREAKAFQRKPINIERGVEPLNARLGPHIEENNPMQSVEIGLFMVGLEATALHT